MELIKIDIDRPPNADRWWAHRKTKRVWYLLHRVEELCHVSFDCVRVRRSRKGIHIIAEPTKHLKPTEIVAIQAICGSDPVREILNLHRIRAGFPVWNMMFTEKNEYKGERRLKGKHSREHRL